MKETQIKVYLYNVKELGIETKIFCSVSKIGHQKATELHISHNNYDQVLAQLAVTLIKTTLEKDLFEIFDQQQALNMEINAICEFRTPEHPSTRNSGLN